MTNHKKSSSKKNTNRVRTKAEFDKLMKAKKKVHPIIAMSKTKKSMSPAKLSGLKLYG